jgi:hypothetical protein
MLSTKNSMSRPLPVAGSFVAEVLGHGQAGQRHAQAVARRLVHLAVHHRHLVEHVRVFHLVVEVVALAGTLAHAGEHRQARVLLRDVVDQLHHVDGLADAGATEQADLAALGEGAHQVDHLDAGFEQFVGGRLVFIRRRGAVDFPARFRVHRAGFVDRRTQHVHDAAKRGLADRHRDCLASVVRDQVALQAVGGTERNGAHDAVAELLLHFQRDVGAVDLERVVHLRHVFAREFDVDDGADDLDYLTLRVGCVHGLSWIHVFDWFNGFRSRRT